MADFIQNNFNNGEISTESLNRFDISKFFNSCEIMQRFVAIPQGGATMVPGSYYCGTVKDSTKTSRLFPFIFSKDQAYQLEFGDYYVRFYFKNKSQVVSTDGTCNPFATGTYYWEGAFCTYSGTTYRSLDAHTSAGSWAADSSHWSATTIAEISTPYPNSELYRIKVTGCLDVLYIFHPSYPTMKLVRYDHTHWVLSTVVWNRGPFQAENIDLTFKITPSVSSSAWVTSHSYTAGDYVTNSGTTYRCLINHTSGTFATDLSNGKWTDPSRYPLIDEGTSITLTSTASLFDISQVGSYWQISHWRDIPKVQDLFGSTQNGNPIEIYGNWELETHGSWQGKFHLQKSEDNGTTWLDFRYWKSNQDYNVLSTGNEIKEKMLYRVSFERDGYSCSYALKNVEPIWNGVVKITDYTSATQVTATVIKRIWNNSPTSRWSKPVFSDLDGYPTCGAFYQGRLWLGRGNWVCASKSSDLENMESTSLDDGSIVRQMDANTLENIYWIVPSSNEMIIGTQSGIWKIEALDSSKALTPTNIKLRKESSVGANDACPAYLVGNVVVYLHKSPKQMYYLGYSFPDDKWIPSELTILFRHITEDYSISQMVFQETPIPILWCLRSDGLLFGITFNTEHKIIGAHRHPTDGTVSSISVIPGDNNEDCLWTITTRNTTKCIEANMPFSFGEKEDAFFVQSGLTFCGVGPIAITNVTNENPGKVYCSTANLTNGMQVKFSEVTNSNYLPHSQINNQVFTVYGKTGTYFTLKDSTNSFGIDTTGWGTYLSGGILNQVEKDFTGLAHLAGKVISPLVDGIVHRPVGVNDSGGFSLDYFGNKIQAGLFYPAILKPVKPEIAMSTSMGPVSLKGTKRKINNIILTFKKSIGGIFGEDENDILSAVNLIKNGNFETTYLGTEWIDVNTPEVSARSSTIYHYGSYSWHINDSVPSYGGRKYLATWKKGKRYKLNVWYKVISGTVNLNLYDNNGERLGSTTNAATDWTLWSLEFQGDSDYGTQGAFEIKNASNGVAAEFYFTELEVYEIKNLSTEPLIPTKAGIKFSNLQIGDSFNAEPDLFTGEKGAGFPGGFGAGASLVICQDKPLPMTIISILYNFDSYAI